MSSKVFGVFVDKDIHDSVVPIQGVTCAPGEVEYAPSNFPKFWVQSLRLDHSGGDYIGPWLGWLYDALEFLNIVL